MKRTDLEKSIGSKITGKIQSKSESGPFNKGTAKPVDKREQRKLYQAMGLVPFAVKISIELVQRIQEIAEEEKTGINEVVADLLKKGIEGKKQQG